MDTRFIYHLCRYDAIVVGLGGHGSAALYHLAQRGVKVKPEPTRAAYKGANLKAFTHSFRPCQVLGLEQYSVAHDKGSSHGESRIIRLAYHEHPDYVPLLRRAWSLWEDLQRKTGQVPHTAPSPPRRSTHPHLPWLHT